MTWYVATSSGRPVRSFVPFPGSVVIVARDRSDPSASDDRGMPPLRVRPEGDYDRNDDLGCRGVTQHAAKPGTRRRHVPSMHREAGLQRRALQDCRLSHLFEVVAVRRWTRTGSLKTVTPAIPSRRTSSTAIP